ncbi:50S ribosomal protein L29 [Candidatus Woesearchaeota archaeon]|nr:MAG: 50S ribosomal protein L29 [Candidatus Woesearchaeota archaeon]
MAKIKASELRKMDLSSLKSKLDDLRKDLLKVNAQRSMGTALENPGQVKQIKKAIARVLMVINEKSKNKINNQEESEKQ